MCVTASVACGRVGMYMNSSAVQSNERCMESLCCLVDAYTVTAYIYSEQQHECSVPHGNG